MVGSEKEVAIMVKSIEETTTLHNGVKMPWLGFGVYQAKDGEEVINAVKYALKHGYRSIDTAAYYKNEEGVGQAIKQSGVAREDIFLTTKVWNSDHGYESTLRAFDESLKRLDVDYLDLYLIHWPGPNKESYIDTWRALEKLYQDGRVRAIGVCNFHIHHLEELLKVCEIKPMVNQVEYHPHLTQEELLSFCQKEKIQLEAWSPLKRGDLLHEPTLVKIAEAHNKTVAQVILRWDLQNKVVTIPKSVHEERIIANANIFDFELTDEEMKQMNSLNQNSRRGPNPDEFKVDFE